jgi:predicted PurR-regulated permease PerM
VDVLLGSWITRLAGALGVVARVLTPIIGAVVSIFLVFLMSLQMMFAADSLKTWHPTLIPPRYRVEVGALGANIVQMWVSFIRGQLTLMLLMGVLSAVGYLILGVPQALLLGALAGLLELIPSLGPTLAAIPAVLFSLILGSTLWSGIPNLAFALIVTAFCVLLQLLENQVIVPRLMGDAVKLPPLIVLIGVIVGGSAFGILGAFLSTPMIATFDQIFRFTYRKIQEQPAVDPPEPEEPGLVEKVTGFLRGTAQRLGRGITK